MKKDIRKNMIEIRDKQSEDEIVKLSRDICRNILEWEIYRDAKTIMMYSSIRSEVRTTDLINQSLKMGKNVILPKTIKEGRHLIPYAVESLEDLEAGMYGILEPKDSLKIIEKRDIDIVFVPGVAYDERGYRIGYGAGYYDRFLRDYEGVKAGLCFNFQILKDVFHDEYDIMVDYLISEKGITKTGDN